MFILEEKELEKAIEFLNILGCDLTFVDYIEKNNTIYHAKTFEPVHDLLIYLLFKYGDFTEIHFHFNEQNKNFDLRIRMCGQINSILSIINIKDDYSTIQFGTNSYPYSTEYFKDIIRTLSVPNSTKYGQADFVHDVNLPVFGHYRLRMATLGCEGIVRLLRKDENNSNNNVLKINPNPVYIFEAEIKNDTVNCNSNITITSEIIQKIKLYDESLSKMFDSMQTHINKPLNFWKVNKMKVYLEYKNSNEISVDISKNYLIDQPFMETSILQYLYKNYQDFYDPVFKNFIEDVTQIKIDPTMGEFKTPEDLKRYLILLDMIKI